MKTRDEIAEEKEIYSLLLTVAAVDGNEIVWPHVDPLIECRRLGDVGEWHELIGKNATVRTFKRNVRESLAAIARDADHGEEWMKSLGWLLSGSGRRRAQNERRDR